MKRFLKWFVGLLLAGTVIGILISRFRKDRTDTCAIHNTTDDDNFDLDIDLQPVANREYVPLTPHSEDDDLSES